eukprot:289899-Hanusia_phi.AAC.1
MDLNHLYVCDSHSDDSMIFQPLPSSPRLRHPSVGASDRRTRGPGPGGSLAVTVSGLKPGRNWAAAPPARLVHEYCIIKSVQGTRRLGTRVGTPRRTRRPGYCASTE